MELTLKDRKKINNLPKFTNGQTGLTTPWAEYQNNNLAQTGSENTLPYTGPNYLQIVTEEPKGIFFNKNIDLNKTYPLYNTTNSAQTKPNYFTSLLNQNFVNTQNLSNRLGAVIRNQQVSQSNTNKNIQSMSAAGPWGALAAGVLGGIAEGVSSQDKKEQILSDADITNQQIGGVLYSVFDNVGKNTLRDYQKNAYMSYITNPVASTVKQLMLPVEMKNWFSAINEAENINTFRRGSAYTEALQQDYNLKHTDTRNTFLHAENGKDAVEAAGGETSMKLNAWVNKGEYIWDGGMNLNYIDHGPNDTAKAFVKDTDTVFTTKYGIADMVPYAAMTGQLPILAEYQRMLHNNYKNGKDAKKLADGWDNIATSGLGALMSLGLIIDASRQRIKIPNIYAQNRYGNRTLTTLAGIHSNPYPILSQMRSAYSLGRYDINRAGGLSGAQKYLANTALAVQNQRNIANSLAQLQHQENAYRTNYANTAAQIGAQEASNLQLANQFREQYTAAAHAAKQQGKQMGLRNLMDYVNQFYKNRNKSNEFNRMYDLYAQDNAIRAKQYGLL